VHRLPLYQAALTRLRSSGSVFGCSCSRSEILRLSREGVYLGTCRERGLSLDAGEVAWRLRTGDDAAGSGAGPAVLRVKGFPTGEIEARLPVEMQDFVVRKKDGFPAYQLSSVVDDLPLLTSPLGEKLSKSAGATSIQYLRKQGLKAADIYAMIARAFVNGDAAASAFAGRTDAAASVHDWAGLAALVLDGGANH
jgi:glutamyl/glutaminyl-tRNA synthetase